MNWYSLFRRALPGALALSLLASSGWCGVHAGGEKTRAKWTVMLYLVGDDDGDNPVEHPQLDQLEAMLESPRPEGVTVVAQMDRSKKDSAQKRGFYTDTSKTGAFRYVLGKDKWLSFGGDDGLGEVNMGDPKTLAEFMKWTHETYPAERYALVIDGHGSGIISYSGPGALWDSKPGRVAWQEASYSAEPVAVPESAIQGGMDSAGIFGFGGGAPPVDGGLELGSTEDISLGYDDSHGDSLTYFELRKVFGKFRQLRGGKKLDLFGMYACYGSNLEGLYELRDEVLFAVGSPAPMTYSSQRGHDPFLKQLDKRPDSTPRQVARGIVNEFYRTTRKNKSRETVGAWDMSAIGELAAATSELADKVRAAKIRKIPFDGLVYFDWNDKKKSGKYADFTKVVRRLETLARKKGASDLRATAVKLRKAYKKARVTVASMGKWAKKGSWAGMSIYLPNKGEKYDGAWRKYYKATSFAKDLHWDELLDDVWNRKDRTPAGRTM